MAKPWKHPQTGVYYLRRQVPKAIRAAFDGRQLHKASLGTKDGARASVLFLQANAELDLQFQAARDRLKTTGSPCPTSRDKAVELVEGYFNGPEREPGGLTGQDRLLLARLEVDRGLWNETSHGGLSPVGPSSAEEWWQLTCNAAKFCIHPGTRHRIQGHVPGAIWQMPDTSFRLSDSRERQVMRIVEQIALHNDLAADKLPAETGSAIIEFLDALPVGSAQTRKPRAASGRLRPTMRLMELFADWKDGQKPRPQSAAEYESAALDFIDFLGDIPVAEIERSDLLDFRDEVEKLPASMPKSARALPFTQRVDRPAPAKDGKRPAKCLSAASVKKRVGAIQALLTYAHKQEWTKLNVGRDVPITGYSKTGGLPRDTFADEQLHDLVGSPLFTAPAAWSWMHKTSDCTLYWVFMLCMTTGARIEEVGQALLADVKSRDGALYIDVDDYVEDRSADDDSDVDDDEKSIKTRTSRRVVPVHDRVAALGFADYCNALRTAGHNHEDRIAGRERHDSAGNNHQAGEPQQQGAAIQAPRSRGDEQAGEHGEDARHGNRLPRLTFADLKPRGYDANLFAAIFDLVEDRLRATVVGIIVAIAYLVGSISPLAMGWLKQQYGITSSLQLLAAVSVAAGLTFLLLVVNSKPRLRETA